MPRRGKAVAIVSDEAMLMSSEISTAAKYRAQAVWIVMNDKTYGTLVSQSQALGLATDHLAFPGVNFVQMAQSMGADGVRVENETDLDNALERAMAAPGPFVIDVCIATDEPSPLEARFGDLGT